MKRTICMLMSLVLAILPATVYAQQNSDLNILEEEPKVIYYTDDGTEILSRQKVIGGIAQISSVVPQKAGKIFCGWRTEGKKGLFKPGQTIESKNDILLSAVWESGNLPHLKLKAVSDKDGGVTFSLDFSYGGFMNYAYFAVHIRNLTTADENVFEITDGKITVDSLPQGQYKAVLSAKKYDIEYLSDAVNFVVLSGITETNDTLKLVMDGKDLIFADEQPQLIGNYTYIAVRPFCESMNARVAWKNEDRSSTITLGGTIIKLFENSDECIVNGTLQKLPVKTIIKNGRMLLPLRSVAEFCNAEILWDDNRTVYIYRGNKSIFEENMMYISTSEGKYLGVDSDGISLKGIADYGCGWIFDAVDVAKGIYIIYSLTDLEKPIRINDSVVVSGQKVMIDKTDGFDGHLWRLRENNDGTYTISPANNTELYFDVENLLLTDKPVKLNINHINNLGI